MKVMLVNGSPHKYGCTNRALEEVARALEADGVEAESSGDRRQAAGRPRGVRRLRQDGGVRVRGGCERVQGKGRRGDGFVFGAPVHYAHAASSLLGFMDRLFYSNGRAGTPTNVLPTSRPQPW